MDTKTFKLQYIIPQNVKKEELKKEIISHMTHQSLDMEISISTIKIEEVNNNNAC